MDNMNVSDIARALGSIKTEKKSASSRVNVAKARERLQDADVRALLSDKQKARRERERLAKEAAAQAAGPVQKRPPGRPRKEVQTVEATGEKRGRGRPKKQPDALTMTQTDTNAVRGAQEG